MYVMEDAFAVNEFKRILRMMNSGLKKILRRGQPDVRHCYRTTRVNLTSSPSMHQRSLQVECFANHKRSASEVLKRFVLFSQNCSRQGTQDP